MWDPKPFLLINSAGFSVAIENRGHHQISLSIELIQVRYVARPPDWTFASRYYDDILQYIFSGTSYVSS